jgi:hypothetical protein
MVTVVYAHTPHIHTGQALGPVHYSSTYLNLKSVVKEIFEPIPEFDDVEPVDCAVALSTG